ncbi:hypothetical protein [Sphingosinicella rhizophila]|uniref:Uncharacterized protein n=1 Tax=Sphingosinicella rhizophila TaxID=3050082 RepID=A0ABU3QBN0_9SPHN|nr:hypothetical protein [Sphingosinicella sp. GR2756]MDT9600810.1 hypothetical protein [Sphingosinicella sp. GR2756]
MIWSAAAMLLVTMGVGAEPAPEPAQPTRYTRIVRERIVVRVPARAARTSLQTSLITWREGRGPKCIRAQNIAGARIRGRSSVDLILKNNRRFRARLANSCPALDYYYGFYIDPNPDGLVCADRDLIRSRMGGQCGIEAFRSLQPVRRLPARIEQ